MDEMEKRLKQMNRSLNQQDSQNSKLWKSIGQNLSHLGSSITHVDKSVDEFASATGKVVGSLVFFRNNIGSMAGWTTTLATGLAAAASTVSESVDAYRQMMEVGQDFNGSLLDLQKSAASANLPLEEFVALIGKNNLVVASTGVQAFTDLGKSARTSLKQFGMLGLTTNQFNEYLSQYAETARLYGNSESLSSTQATLSLQKLAKETTAYSQLTGKARQEILADSQRAMRTASIQVMMAKMTSSGSAAMQQVLQSSVSYLSALPGEAGKSLNMMLAETVGLGSSAVSDSIQDFNKVGLGAVGGLMDDLARKVKSGVATDADRDAFRNSFVSLIGNNLDSLQAQLLGPNRDLAAKSIQMYTELRNLQNKSANEVTPEQKATTFFLNIQENMAKLTGFLRLKLFTAFESIYNSVMKAVNSGAYDQLIAKFEVMLGKVANWIDAMAQPENLEAWGTGIGETINGIIWFSKKLIEGYQLIDKNFFTPIGKWWDESTLFKPIKDSFGSLGGGVMVIVGSLLLFNTVLGSLMAGMGALIMMMASGVKTVAMGGGGAAGGVVRKGVGAVASKVVGKASVAGAALDIANATGVIPEGAQALAGVASKTLYGVQLGSMFGPWGMAIGGILGAIYGIISDWDNVKKEVTDLGSKAGELISSAWTSTIQFGSEIMNTAYTKFIEPMVKWITEWYSDSSMKVAIDSIVGWFSSFKTMIFDNILILWNKIKEFKELAGTLASASFDKIVGLAKSGVNAASNALGVTTGVTPSPTSITGNAAQPVPTVNTQVLQQQVNDLAARNKTLEDNQSKMKSQLDRLIEVISKGNADTTSFLRDIADGTATTNKYSKKAANTY